MNFNDMYQQPQQLAPLLIMDDQTILSPTIPRQYLMRQIGIVWYRVMEEIYDNEPIGTRILVRRDTYYHPLVDTHITHDYITTRVGHETVYGHWTHQNVAYLHNEVSPLPITIDAFTTRDEIMSNNRNNQDNPEHNPFPEGHVIPEGHAFPEGHAIPDPADLLGFVNSFLQQPPPGLSSNLLFFH